MTVYTNPHILPLRAENIPGELKARPQWVVWKAVGDKPDKVPYSARSRRRASSTDLLTWSTFQEALEAYETGEYAGLGFMFSSADPSTGIDLDNCVVEDGEIALWLRRWHATSIATQNSLPPAPASISSSVATCPTAAKARSRSTAQSGSSP
jgi:hypothetical protein